MTKYISRTNLFDLLDKLKSEYDVFVPVRKGNHRFYTRYDSPTQDIVIGEVRTFEPLKLFFAHAREIVAEDFEDFIPALKEKPSAIVGVKACDLKGFRIQDFVFMNHNYPDPFYIRNRNNNLIISADCTIAIETCFCIAANGRPYPEKDFDMNLSCVEGGYIVDTGSKRGEEIVNGNLQLFDEPESNFIRYRDEKRKEVIESVNKNIKESSIPAHDKLENVIEKKYESSIWEEEAKSCVECAACTIICPTCHCFLLYDQKDEKRMARFRVWDSCMLKDYARVAGGVNPRPKLWMRLRNRFEKKFDFFPKVAGIYACTGCGRCISACPAKIDIRKILHKLVSA